MPLKKFGDLKAGKNIAECLRYVRRRLFSILPAGLRQTPLRGDILKKYLRFFMCVFCLNQQGTNGVT